MNCKPRAKNSRRHLAVGMFVGLLSALFALPVLGAPQPLLSRHVPMLSALATRLGAMPARQQMDLTIALPLRNREALTNLLAQVYDPASPNFHKYLSGDQFTEQFGPTEADYQAVMAFARTNGLVVTGTHPNRTLVNVRGATADIEKVFHVHMGVYQHPTEARTFFASDVEPSVDLNVPILHIDGLDNLVLSKPNVRGKPIPKFPKASPNGATGNGPAGMFWGYDYRAAYAPGTTLTGAGQQVALIEFEGYKSSDITSYESQCGLPNVLVQNIPINGFSFVPNTLNTNQILEVCLDIEVAIAMAPGLISVNVYGATNDGTQDNNLLNRIATDNSARQISSSWGLHVNTTTQQIFQQYAAQGQSFFMAVGDFDAYSGTISFGYDDPYITVVGGTELTTDAKTNYQSEIVWNYNNTGQTPTNEGTGGGISTTYFIPSWQQNVNMSFNQGSSTFRNIPDVAMVADNVYTVFFGGVGTYTLGTSIAAPLWAGYTALINQQAGANGRPSVGFLNPALYSLGLGPNPGLAFHDITVGNNTNTVSPNRFFAAAGYDLCTGWGSPTGTNLINALAMFGSVVWVDFNYTGTIHTGGYDTPFVSLSSATNVVASGGTIAIKPGNSATPITITKPMTIISAGGNATVGQ